MIRGGEGAASEDEKKENIELKTLLASKKTQLIGCQKEDLIFYALMMQASLAGVASLIAFPSTDTFELQP